MAPRCLCLARPLGPPTTLAAEVVAVTALKVAAVVVAVGAVVTLKVAAIVPTVKELGPAEDSAVADQDSVLDSVAG